MVLKPAGLLVHGTGKSDHADVTTLADWIMENYPEIKTVGESWETETGETIYRPGIVHRLDRDTSGVMVIARTAEMFVHLKEQFQNRQVTKHYLAFIYGHLMTDEGVVEASIGKSRSDFRRWSAQRGARGQLRPAVTEYQVLARVWDNDRNPFTYISFRPKTGRTHQIRVHAKYMHHPIVGDILYAGKNIQTGSREEGVYALGFTRQALHARQISFTELSGKVVTYQALLPVDFVSAEAMLEIAAIRDTAEQ